LKVGLVFASRPTAGQRRVSAARIEEEVILTPTGPGDLALSGQELRLPPLLGTSMENTALKLAGSASAAWAMRWRAAGQSGADSRLDRRAPRPNVARARQDRRAACRPGACDIVFVMVSTWDDVRKSWPAAGPVVWRAGARLVVESRRSRGGSARLRPCWRARRDMLRAPFRQSKVIKAGRLSVVCSGPRAASTRPCLA